MQEDSVALQRDLDTLAYWADIWQMNFNPSKCAIMRCFRASKQYVASSAYCLLTLKM